MFPKRIRTTIAHQSVFGLSQFSPPPQFEVEMVLVGVVMICVGSNSDDGCCGHVVVVGFRVVLVWNVFWKRDLRSEKVGTDCILRWSCFYPQLFFSCCEFGDLSWVFPKLKQPRNQSQNALLGNLLQGDAASCCLSEA